MTYCRLSNVTGFYHKLSINILMVEYRGYGLSEGSPSERGLYVDAQSAVDYLLQRNDIDTKRIIVFGRSLGKLLTVPVKFATLFCSCLLLATVFYIKFKCIHMCNTHCSVVVTLAARCLHSFTDIALLNKSYLSVG